MEGETDILARQLLKYFGQADDPASERRWRYVAERIEAGDSVEITLLRDRVGCLEKQPWPIRRLMLMIADIEQAALLDAAGREPEPAPSLH